MPRQFLPRMLDQFRVRKTARCKVKRHAQIRHPQMKSSVLEGPAARNTPLLRGCSGGHSLITSRVPTALNCRLEVAITRGGGIHPQQGIPSHPFFSTHRVSVPGLPRAGIHMGNPAVGSPLPEPRRATAKKTIREPMHLLLSGGYLGQLPPSLRVGYDGGRPLRLRFRSAVLVFSTVGPPPGPGDFDSTSRGGASALARLME